MFEHFSYMHTQLPVCKPLTLLTCHSKIKVFHQREWEKLGFDGKDTVSSQGKGSQDKTLKLHRKRDEKTKAW